MLLFISACARPQSRTLALAEKVIQKIPDSVEVLDLYKDTPKPIDYAALTERDSYISKGDFSDPIFRYARQLCAADEIVIAAPFWDLSFPSVLKCWIESVCINGLTFVYNDKGIPEGLCRAKRLIYVTTAGGFIPENNYGYNYIRQLCSDFFGIEDTVCIKAEGLDMIGADIPMILRSAEEKTSLL